MSDRAYTYSQENQTVMLGLHAYHASQKIHLADHPFYALIAAAMCKADTNNLRQLRSAFPGLYEELAQRYDAPLGVLPEDKIADMGTLQKTIKEFYAQ